MRDLYVFPLGIGIILFLWGAVGIQRYGTEATRYFPTKFRGPYVSRLALYYLIISRDVPEYIQIGYMRAEVISCAGFLLISAALFLIGKTEFGLFAIIGFALCVYATVRHRMRYNVLRIANSVETMTKE
jgi:hypothetical protein